jgi:hypothetical protein
MLNKKMKKHMLTRVILMMVFVWGNYAFGQLIDCKVIMPDISGSYSGGCKKGLAHGNGIAQGKDRYEGQFIKGVPDGRGTYTWADGAFYEGQWRNGLKDGKGRLVIGDSILTGFWRDNRYMGEELIASYVIKSNVGVSRYTVKRTIGSLPGVKLRIMQGGADNHGIDDFSLAYDSGDEYRLGPMYGIQNVLFPLNVHVRYRTWNAFRTAQYRVFFEFTINEPGSWDVVITN